MFHLHVSSSCGLQEVITLAETGVALTVPQPPRQQLGSEVQQPASAAAAGAATVGLTRVGLAQVAAETIISGGVQGREPEKRTADAVYSSVLRQLPECGVCVKAVSVCATGFVDKLREVSGAGEAPEDRPSLPWSTGCASFSPPQYIDLNEVRKGGSAAMWRGCHCCCQLQSRCMLLHIQTSLPALTGPGAHVHAASA